jgi:dTMP kinase
MFITFEGPDGSGKTTQINPLSDYLSKKGYSVLITREPGGTSIGDQIRKILSDLKNTGMHPRSETLLFLAARAQLVEEVIIKSLIEFATGGLKPDLTLLFDMDVEEGLQRKAHGCEWNRLDAYSLEFHQRVREGYHVLVESEPKRWVRIEAGQAPDEIQAAIREIVQERLLTLVGS